MGLFGGGDFEGDRILSRFGDGDLEGFRGGGFGLFDVDKIVESFVEVLSGSFGVGDLLGFLGAVDLFGLSCTELLPGSVGVGDLLSFLGAVEFFDLPCTELLSGWVGGGGLFGDGDLFPLLTDDTSFNLLDLLNSLGTMELDGR